MRRVRFATWTSEGGWVREREERSSSCKAGQAARGARLSKALWLRHRLQRDVPALLEANYPRVSYLAGVLH